MQGPPQGWTLTEESSGLATPVLKGKQEVLTQAFPGDQYANLRNAKIEADT